MPKSKVCSPSYKIKITLINSVTQNKRVKYDITMTERCPLCEEDIQVGTAGPQGLAQHQGKKKCLANVKKKKQDAAKAKEPTLFAYLHQKVATQPTAIDLARDVERNEAEGFSRVVVSYGTTTHMRLETYATQHKDQESPSQHEDAGLSADLDLDLGSDLDRDLNHAWDRDKPLAWSTIKVKAKVMGCEPGCRPQERSTTPNDEPNDIQNEDRTLQEAQDAQGLVQRCARNPQDRPQTALPRTGCHKGWILLDHLRAEIGHVCEVLEDSEDNELVGYNRDAALSICADVPRDELWENVNPGLDRILGFRKPQDEIVAMVQCSQKGLQGLYEYLEVLVEQGGVVGGLLEGKIDALMTAMVE